MQLIINGEPRQVDDGLTIAGLLGLMQLDTARVAVERNRDVVPREQFSSIELLEEDCLEIVQFVGGG